MLLSLACVQAGGKGWPDMHANILIKISLSFYFEIDLLFIFQGMFDLSKSLLNFE